MNNQSDRFSLLELDIDGAAPVATYTVQPAAPVVSDVTGDELYGSPGVSAEGKARAVSDEEMATAEGFSLKPPVYEIGRLLNSTGVANLGGSQKDHAESSSVPEACSEFIELIKAEDRQDLLVKVPSLSMLPDGRITRGGGPLAVAEHAFAGIGRHITPSGGTYLRTCPPDLRAINFNHWTSQGYREDMRATSKAMEAWEKGGEVGGQPGPVLVEKEINVRTRLNHSSAKREAFAFVGKRYSTESNVDDIARQVMESDAIPADAKCKIRYDGFKARIDVLFHSNVQPEKAVAGEIFKAGILITTADDGSGAIKVSAQMWRNLCLNLLIIDHAKVDVTTRRHMGTGIADAVAAGIATAMGKVKHFADKWSEATLENVLEKYGVNDIEAVMRGLVFNKVVHVAGVRPEEMFERLMRAYQQEPGYGKTAVVNAVTRCAHEESWTRWTDTEDLERVGGALLFAKVWNVAIPEDEREGLSY